MFMIITEILRSHPILVA